MSLSSPSFHLHRPLFHLSSLMNRCCSAARVNMMDWVAGRHILLLRESEWGHLDSEAHARLPGRFCVSHLLSSSSLTFRRLYSPKPTHQHSTTHCPVHLSPCQPFCSTDHLPVICPCPQLEKPVNEKVRIFIIRSSRPLRDEERMKVKLKVTQCFWDWEITYHKKQSFKVWIQVDITHFMILVSSVFMTTLGQVAFLNGPFQINGMVLNTYVYRQREL